MSVVQLEDESSESDEAEAISLVVRAQRGIFNPSAICQRKSNVKQTSVEADSQVKVVKWSKKV